jgi:hypothetical protein
MAKKEIKRCSTSLFFRNANQSHLIPNRMATYKRKKNVLQGYKEIGTLVYSWWYCKMV